MWRPEKKYPRPKASQIKSLCKRINELANTKIGGNETVSLSFLGSGEMAEVNANFLAHKGDTDVICFDYRESACAMNTEAEDTENIVAVDILICPAVAEREARKRSLSYSREVVLYLVHGFLHAAGCDDLKPELKRKMRVAEHRVMNGLEKEFNLDEIFPAPLEN